MSCPNLIWQAAARGYVASATKVHHQRAPIGSVVRHCESLTGLFRRGAPTAGDGQVTLRTVPAAAREAGDGGTPGDATPGRPPPRSFSSEASDLPSMIRRRSDESSRVDAPGKWQKTAPSASLGRQVAGSFSLRSSFKSVAKCASPCAASRTAPGPRRCPKSAEAGSAFSGATTPVSIPPAGAFFGFEEEASDSQSGGQHRPPGPWAPPDADPGSRRPAWLREPAGPSTFGRGGRRPTESASAAPQKRGENPVCVVGQAGA